MDLNWYVKRLARMSAKEIAHRIRDEAVKVQLRTASSRIRPKSEADQLPGYMGRIEPPDQTGSAAQSLLDAGEALLEGRWTTLGLERDDLRSPDWHLDPVTGIRAPADKSTHSINHRDPAVVGSIKQTWELSRHHHTTALASAYLITSDERYATAAVGQIRSWIDANPFLRGVGWSSGIEMALRLISWVWTRRLLSGWDGAAEAFEGSAAFRESVYHHQYLLDRLPSRYSSANNHMVAEVAGQFVASCAFRLFPESERWRDRAADGLRLAIREQTFESGLNRELATDYHGFVLELFLVAALEGEAAGHPLGTQVWQGIMGMTDAIASIVDAGLNPPRQGGGDDGTALLIDAPTYDRWTSLLATGAALFGAPDWWPELHTADIRSGLLSRFAAAPELAQDRPASRRNVFPDAGMVLLRDHQRSADEIWCRFDAGPHGFLSIAAHAHADALSVEVRHGGTEVLADPGTYAYHLYPEWRSYFRSTKAHNTLELADEQQSVSGGSFNWTSHAESELRAVRGLDEGPVAECSGAHFGYRRLDPAATHLRTVRLDRIHRQLEIEDTIETAGQHPGRLSYHLGPSVVCRLEGRRATLEWQGDGSAIMELPESLNWELVLADDDSRMAWYSPSFGKRVKASVLVGRGTVDSQTRYVTRLRFSEGQSESASKAAEAFARDRRKSS